MPYFDKDDESTTPDILSVMDETAEAEYEAIEEEAELSDSSHTENWLMSFLLNHQKDPHDPLDKTALKIAVDIRNKIKEGPKGASMIAEEEKVGVERQLEDNSKQLKELMRFGDTILSNIRVLREEAELRRRNEDERRRAELNERLRMEQIESNANYEMIKARWLELKTLEEPLELYEQIENEKKNVDVLMEAKDKLIAECAAEVSHLNDNYQRSQNEKNHDLDCLGSSVLHQFDLLSKATKEHLEMLEATVDDEWQYLLLVTKQKWDLLITAAKANEKRMSEIIQDKEKLYEQEIERITEKQEEITRQTRVRLEKEAEQLQLELREAAMNWLINSEKNDYNYQVLLRHNSEDFIVTNQQKRRLNSCSRQITNVKRKISSYLAQSKTKFRKLKENIEKLHQSITELDRKAKQFNRANKTKFDKIWNMQFNELKMILKQILEIDRVLYEQQLGQPWTPIEIDFTNIYSKNSIPPSEHESVFDLDSQIRIREKKYQEHQQDLWELRFLRNILRRLSERSSIYFDTKVLQNLGTYAKQDKFLVAIANVFLVLNINDMNEVKELTEYFKPYAWCPNCQTPPNKTIIQKLYDQNQDLSSTPSTSSRSTRPACNSAYKKSKSSTKKSPCIDHYLVIEPLLVLTAMIDFEQSRPHQRQFVLSFHSRNIALYQINMQIDQIHTFWKKFENVIPEGTLKVWKLLRHSLNHFQLLLTERISLDAQCLQLSKQNYELSYFMGNHREYTKDTTKQKKMLMASPSTTSRTTTLLPTSSSSTETTSSSVPCSVLKRSVPSIYNLKLKKKISQVSETSIYKKKIESKTSLVQLNDETTMMELEQELEQVEENTHRIVPTVRFFL